MNRPAARSTALAAGAIGLIVGGAFAWSASVRSSSEVAIRADLERRAEESKASARGALNDALQRVERAATAAATVPGLQSHLQYGSDRATILDGLQTEDWWREFRDHFPVSGLVAGRVEAVIGLPQGSGAPEALLKAARDSKKATAVLGLGGQPWLASAAEVRAGNGATGVVLLARPLDTPALEAIARAAGGALIVTAGGKVAAAAGPAEEKGRLSSLAERATDALVAGADGTWAAAGEAVAQDVVLWSYAGASAGALASAMIDKRLGTLILAAGAALALAAAIAGALSVRKALRKAPGAPVSGSGPLPQALEQARTPAPDDVSNSKTRVWVGGGPELDPPRAAAASTPIPLGGTDTPSRPTLIPGSGLNPDRVFGPYYLLDKLATGGMGEVFAAVAFGAEGFKRIFVVKRLRPELNENPELIHQFINEARLGAALVHSNIIPIFDFGKVSEHYYLAEEYILGRNLELLVSRNLESQRRTLSMELTLYVIHETLKALAYAHSRSDEGGAPMGLVHRDISPSNIMISSRGEVKLLDFGIAKHAGRASTTNQTRHGVVKGNMTYMAPEQARGLPVDARTDLFSLGLVVYRCLAGRPLYQGTELHHLLLKAAEGPGEEEWERIQALPEPASHLLSKALQPDPAMRFGSAEEFAAAIPHLPRSSAANLSSMVQVLFSEELRREQQQINAAISSATKRAATAS